MIWLDGITDLMGMSLSKLREIVRTGKFSMLQFMGSQRVGQDLVTEQNNSKSFLNLKKKKKVTLFTQLPILKTEVSSLLHHLASFSTFSYQVHIT